MIRILPSARNRFAKSNNLYYISRVIKKKIFNIAIFAHVDAGKTTITETMLYFSGAKKEMGNVDKGTSSTDSLDVERERGISVRSATACVEWNGSLINIIDTPGHVDFSAEVERALLAPDIAILVISAVEGIQAQTQSIWEVLREKKVPTLFFINKIDRLGADPESVAKEIKSRYKIQLAMPQKIQRNPESNELKMATVFSETGQSDEIIEILAENDQALLEMYAEDITFPFKMLTEQLRKQIASLRVYPLLYGAAIKQEGIREMMDFIVDFMPEAPQDENEPPSAVVFKIEHHPVHGRQAVIRVFKGTLKNRDSIRNHGRNIEEKIHQIRKIYSDKLHDIGEISAGDIAIVSGLKETRSGEVIGDPAFLSENIQMNRSVIRVLVSPKKQDQYLALSQALTILSDEDPMLNLQWNREARELYIHIMGQIQIEIIESMLRNRFGLEVDFGAPIVIYMETPAQELIGFEEYTMPKPCWAVVKYQIIPGEAGSGVKFTSKVPFAKIEQKYQVEIEKNLWKSLKQGPLGWEVSDLEIRLIDGEHHNVHSRSGDFTVATAMAIMKALNEGGTRLLEPVLAFRIDLPADAQSRVTGELIRMRSEISDSQIFNQNARIIGTVPVATSIDFPIKLGAMTGGLGKYQVRFDSYRECPLEHGLTRPYQGINPLDRSKYILSARKAL